jgi:hypothetical protein
LHRFFSFSAVVLVVKAATIEGLSMRPGFMGWAFVGALQKTLHRLQVLQWVRRVAFFHPVFQKKLGTPGALWTPAAGTFPEGPGPAWRRNQPRGIHRGVALIRGQEIIL